MGFLAEKIKSLPKYDVAFTVVEIVSLSDNRRTTVEILDACYSAKGVIVKTYELPSFDGEYSLLYNHYLRIALSTAKTVEE